MAEFYRSAMEGRMSFASSSPASHWWRFPSVMPWAVFTRYVLNSAASWPETAAVLLTIVLTFFGAAACYRLGLHMSVTVGADMLPPRARQVADFAR